VVADAARHPFVSDTADIEDRLPSFEDEVAQRRITLEVVQSDGLKDRRLLRTISV